jgi:2-polyprenyl-3-methyl-5-hydroxy-6-metoxy-1,4-benzoquinol methylase
MRVLRPRGKCLEVGAGPGILACLLAKEHPGIDITAFDFSPAMVDLAREYISRKGLETRIHYVCGDVNSQKEMEQLGTFDLIYSSFSLHHWRDPEKSIRNLWSGLKDSGVLYIYDLKRVWWLYLLPIKGGFIDSIRASFRPGEIAAIFEKLDITDYEVETTFPFFIQSIIARK